MIFRNIRNKRENTTHIRKYGKIASTGGLTSSSLTEAFMLKKWQWLGGMSEKLHKDCKHKVIVIAPRVVMVCGVLGLWGQKDFVVCVSACKHQHRINRQKERERERERERARGFDPAPRSKYLSCPWKVMLSFTNWKHICVCALCDRRPSGWKSSLRALQNARK